MPAKRLSMRKIREVLRLKWVQGLSNRQIAEACGIARPTVSEYLSRAAEAGLYWPLPVDLDEAALERQLFPPPPSQHGVRPVSAPPGPLPLRFVRHLRISRPLSRSPFATSRYWSIRHDIGLWNRVESVTARRAGTVSHCDLLDVCTWPQPSDVVLKYFECHLWALSPSWLRYIVPRAIE